MSNTIIAREDCPSIAVQMHVLRNGMVQLSTRRDAVADMELQKPTLDLQASAKTEPLLLLTCIRGR